MEQIDILRHAVEALERMNTPYLVVGFGTSPKAVAIVIRGTSRESCESPVTA
jgi:hypothetical protein